MTRRSVSGFTLIELMVVVCILGVLVLIAIPRFKEFQDRAREGAVKNNMHTVHISVEDFALQNDGIYPTSATASLSDGRTLAQVCPTNGFPVNPFTHVASVVQFNANPTLGHAGELGINPALPRACLVKGNDAIGDTLTMVLTSGQ